MKKFLLTFVMLMSISSIVFASNVKVQLNGEIVDFTDSNGNKVEAQIVNSRTMVPMRKIFELLGASIEWDGTTNTVTAIKDDTKIKLQINNEIAEITKSNETQKITLDSKPILINDRTMVPLRFISESLEKQVAWDATNETAIIIDYDYFANDLKAKSPLLYKLITNKTNVTTIQITRQYYDLRNSAYNTSTTAYATVSRINDTQKSLLIDFAGNSELVNDISSEGWSTIALECTYDDAGVSYTTSTPVLKKMLTSNYNTYAELNLTGKYSDSLAEAIKNLIAIEESNIDSTTFSKIKNEYDNFIKIFTFANTTTSSTIKANTINYENANNEYLDYTKFDDVIFENEFIQVYNLVNRLIFNYDVKLDELLYDTSNIGVSATINDSNNELCLKLTIDLTNTYDEKITYNINVVEK